MSLKLRMIGALTPQWYVYMWAVAIAVVSAAVIVQTQRFADNTRRVVVQLTRLEVSGYRVYATEQQAVSGTQYVDQVAPKIRAAQTDLTTTQRDLDRVTNHADALTKVRSAFLRYDSVQKDLYDQLVTARSGAAMTTSLKADEEWESLRKTIADASHVYGRNATRASEAASIGILITLLVAALSSAFLFLRGDKAQRRLTLAEQTALRHSEARFRALVQNANDVIAILSGDGVIRYVSPSAERIWGWGPVALENRHYYELVHSTDLDHAITIFNKSLLSPADDVETEMKLMNSEGEYRESEVVLKNLIAVRGIEGLVVTCRDVTQKKMFERKLHEHAYSDSLTGLANRRRFMDVLQDETLHRHNSGLTLGIFFIDVDNFKVINDSLGHDMGDHLLRQVADRLTACVHRDDTVARLGGDEFTLLIRDTKDGTSVSEMAEQLSSACSAPIRLAGMDVKVTISMGVALSDDTHCDAETILRNADIAMYHAKRAGRNAYRLYTPDMTAEAMERLELEAELRAAINNGQLLLHYQPIYELATGRMTEIEALVRWNHPTRGLIPPGKFIPLAEECGLISDIGNHVMIEALKLSNTLAALYQDCAPVVSVNLSGKQLDASTVVSDLVRIVESEGAVPSRIKFEITESVAMKDVQATILKLKALKSSGFEIAVDDFGTGYSSMAYLGSFPIDTLKIDRSFVQRLTEKPEDDAIVQAIITLATALQLTVTAEGIETEAQLSSLRSMGCTHGQGYLFARPLPERALLDRIADELLQHEDALIRQCRHSSCETRLMGLSEIVGPIIRAA